MKRPHSAWLWIVTAASGAALVASGAALVASDAAVVASGAAGAGDARAYPESGAPYLAVYRWGAANSHGGAGANAAFARWLGLPVVWAEDFEPNERWDSVEGGNWQLNEWADWKKAVPGRRLVLSVPLLPGPWDGSGPKDGPAAHAAVSLADGARGKYDPYFKTLAERLVSKGLGDSILRLGWEFNGGWYTWRAGAAPADFAGYWRQIVRTMRAVPGGESLRFCWNPASGFGQFAAEKAWPGDESVDLVGLDVYDDSWAANTYPWPASASASQIAERRARVWNNVILGGDHGLKFWRDFAIAHHKPFALPEWGIDDRDGGHGGLDDPRFIQRMHDFMVNPANKVYFDCYFDVQAGDGGHQLSPGKSGEEKTRFPESAKKFKALFGADGAAGH